MLHAIMISNIAQPQPMDLFEFTDPFRDVIPEAHVLGEAQSKGLNEKDNFKWTYIRVGNQTAVHDNKFYVFVTFDFDKFPKIEGYVERRVFPELMATLENMADMLGLIYIGKEQREHHVMYTYGCNGAMLSGVVSESIREEIKAKQ